MPLHGMLFMVRDLAQGAAIYGGAGLERVCADPLYRPP